MPEAEDFEPYKALKDAASKVRNFAGFAPAKDTSGPGSKRSAEEIKEAKSMPKDDIDRQNVRAYNFSVRNRPGAKKLEESRKLPSRSSSRR